MPKSQRQLHLCYTQYRVFAEPLSPEGVGLAAPFAAAAEALGAASDTKSAADSAMYRHESDCWKAETLLPPMAATPKPTRPRNVAFWACKHFHSQSLSAKHEDGCLHFSTADHDDTGNANHPDELTSSWPTSSTFQQQHIIGKPTCQMHHQILFHLRHHHVQD